MFSLLTNLFAFIGFIIIILIQFIISLFFNIDKSFLWLLTMAAYILFIIYQITIILHNHFELNKAKNIINDIMLAIKGIPIINENDKIIIKWDMIFKDLIEIKDYNLYDKIVKFKTKKIDFHVNQHPSILLNSAFMNEYKYNKDLESFIISNEENNRNKEIFDEDFEFKKNLFISDISDLKITFSNYDSSIIIDAILSSEYEPINFKELDIEPDPHYDGFSLHMYYNNKKFTIVPRQIVHGQKINKKQWLYDNLDKLFESANKILNGEKDYVYNINEGELEDYIDEIPLSKLSNIPSIRFDSLQKNSLIFKTIDFKKEPKIINCSFNTSYNSFEIILNTIKDEDKTEEVFKTIAIGNSYDPIVYILEKMPQIVRNIDLTIKNKDVKEIII